MAPGEMEHVKIPKALLDKAEGAIVISVEEDCLLYTSFIIGEADGSPGFFDLAGIKDVYKRQVLGCLGLDDVGDLVFRLLVILIQGCRQLVFNIRIDRVFDRLDVG